MKTFNEKQMSDPWKWCLQVLDNHKIKSKDLAEYIGCNRSTIRSLMNQTSSSPKYHTLALILGVCIELENGINLVGKIESSTTLSEPEYDWL